MPPSRSSLHNEVSLAFLSKIDKEDPKDLDIHIIADNYATHKHPTVKAWLARHPRFHMHFTPTSESWLNLVERFFVMLQTQSVKVVSLPFVTLPTQSRPFLLIAMPIQSATFGQQIARTPFAKSNQLAMPY